MGGKVSLVAEEDLEVTLHARLDLIILQVLKSLLNACMMFILDRPGLTSPICPEKEF